MAKDSTLDTPHSEIKPTEPPAELTRFLLNYSRSISCMTAAASKKVFRFDLN
ncbi:MAG: Uncharacterised protein [Flavobacteriia bacterium]|nr:MAG: Uncharacterised protein [Flavobacteriia bacterium]